MGDFSSPRSSERGGEGKEGKEWRERKGREGVKDGMKGQRGTSVLLRAAFFPRYSNVLNILIQVTRK